MLAAGCERKKAVSLWPGRVGKEARREKSIEHNPTEWIAFRPRGWGRGVGTPLQGTCGQPGYGFLGFCLKQGIDFIIFSILSIFVLKEYLFLTIKQPARMFYELNYSKIYKIFRVKCPKQGIKNRNSVFNTSPPKNISSTPFLTRGSRLTFESHARVAKRKAIRRVSGGKLVKSRRSISRSRLRRALPVPST